MLGIGLAATITGTLSYYLDITFTVELFIWALLSAVVVSVWYHLFRRGNTTQSGQSHYRVDTIGIVTEDITPSHHGRVIFDTPVLGNREWPAFANEAIQKDTDVEIVQISGQLIKVKKI
jgi:membrane protein implicated in regulation of membrane protease activity